MIFLTLALKSIRNRKFSTFLTVISIALSTMLLLSVERTKRAAQEGFTGAISQTDLLVGPRTGPLNLLLMTVFNMGNATNNLSWETYQEIKKNPNVEWTIPYSLGDSHRGFRVIGTDENFYEHYRFRQDQKVELQEGVPALGIWDAVIGSEVAQKMNYKLGQKLIMSHGVTHGEGVQHHDDKPYFVSGILKPTGTAIDQSVYISLYGMEAMHIDWNHGAAPTDEKKLSPETIKKENIKIDEITAFFLRTKSRILTLQLQRDLNEYKKEPLTAVMPTATLAEFWHGLGYFEQVLKIISWLVVCVGLASMLNSLLAGLNERRREMAILRSLGASPKHITLLLVLESAVLTVLGVCLGLGVELSSFFLLKNWLESQFGLMIVGAPITTIEYLYLGLTIIFGTFIGIIPAMKAMQNSLKDGLSIKV